jgi:hypothetical protein
MEHNPYSPPATQVADAAPADSRVRPRAVNHALALIAAALAIQLVFQLWALQEVDFRIVDPWQTSIAAVLFVIYGFMCHQLSQGRSWPRIVLLILTLGGFAATCYAIGVMRKLGMSLSELFLMPVFAFNRLLPMVMNFVALHLLFFASGDWFQERK